MNYKFMLNLLSFAYCKLLSVALLFTHRNKQRSSKMKKPMNLTQALAKIEQFYKDQPKQPQQEYQPQPKRTPQESQALYNFMRGMP